MSAKAEQHLLKQQKTKAARFAASIVVATSQIYSALADTPFILRYTNFFSMFGVNIFQLTPSFLEQNNLELEYLIYNLHTSR